MVFIIKTMQLSIEKFITQPQEISPPQFPTRVAFFADIKNMFNCVSQEALMDTISNCFQELLPLAHLLYGRDDTVRYRWEDDT